MFKKKSNPGNDRTQNQRPEFLEQNDINELYQVQRDLTWKKKVILDDLVDFQANGDKKRKNELYHKSVDISIQINMLKQHIECVIENNRLEREKRREENCKGIRFNRIFYRTAKKQLHKFEFDNLKQESQKIFNETN